MVKINMRGKNLSALVLESRDAMEAKTEIKSADFQLKKITGFSSKPFLQKEFLEAVKKTAEYFAATAGGVLFHLIPSIILENNWQMPSLSASDKKENSDKKTKNEIAVLQASDEERLALYKSLIREEFAKKKSVFLCLPQNEDVRQVKEKLERGIEPFVCSFHNEMSKKEIKAEWKKACFTNHPVFVIGTAKWLFMPRNDFGTIIIDKENENGWKTLSRPFIDLRLFAENLADKKNIRIVIGDLFLKTETLYRYKNGEISEFESVKWRMSSETKPTIADMREPAKKATITGRQEKEFKVLSEEMLGLINETVSRGSHMFIFAARKGLSAVTVCRDCGEQVKCGNCSSPMVLYKTKSGGAFRCHQCGETRDAAEVCQNCGSWKLAAFGLGIDRVGEEIRKNIQDIKLFEINKNVTGTATKALSVAEEFYEKRGSILLGTEMAFAFLHKKVANSAIASFDSLFSIPDFRIREKIFRLILQTKDIAKENFLIQTRNPADPTINFAITGNLIEFYKKEIEDRQILSYPPFDIFIKITTRGTRNFVTKETENLKNILKEYNATIFNSVHEKKGEQAAINAVIKIPKEKWPHFTETSGDKPNLLSILKSLPPHFEIKVDPDNLL